MIGSTAKVFTDIETNPGGYPVNATPTANNIPVLDSQGALPYKNGWTPVTDTWTYASASTIIVPSGAASLYQKGDRIKWTQTTVKYGVIVAVADTLLTIAVNTDYTVANAAISAIFYSHQASPLGFPSTFNYSLVWTNTSTNPAIVNGTILARFNITENICTVWVTINMGASTTYGTGSIYLFSLPVTALYSTQFSNPGPAHLTDISAGVYIAMAIRESATTVRINPTGNLAQPTCQNVPFTYASGDYISFGMQYEI
jgi:hypothetical protein